jgi:glutamine synthetase
MTKCKLEYIWLDGYQPTQSLRSKTLVVNDFSGKVEDAKMWSFDGSSTEQAPGGASDCLLKPVFVCPDPGRLGTGFLVMCEVLSSDGTPHKSNGRATIEDDDNDFWFGFEQEYTIWDPEISKPVGFPVEGFPGPQGPYYCSVGHGKAVGRDIVEEHLELCLEAGLNVEGINAEVMMGQWEFQIGPAGTVEAADQVWMARYLLYRVAEDFDVAATLDPKPIKGDWNGAGAHTNFSTKQMRESYEPIIAAAEALGKKADLHITNYGAGVEDRLTGAHETAPWTDFSYGVSNRGASIRIPWQVEKDGKGYLEDRRPNANMNPYVVTKLITETVCSAASGEG